MNIKLLLAVCNLPLAKRHFLNMLGIATDHDFCFMSLSSPIRK